MTHALIAAKSGWGKSYLAQWWIEDNLKDYPVVVVLDRRDEFRGLVKSGFCQWGIIGPNEVNAPASAWQDVFEENGRMVLARHKIHGEDWMNAVASIIQAALSLEEDVLVCIDEAHKVAPQSGNYPEPLETLATEGRGRCASLWITQRLAKLDETPIGEMMVYLLGGFQSDADLRKVGRNVGYPQDVHKVGASRVAGLPEDLHAPDEGAVPVRKFTDENGSTVGSEWVYSDDSGRHRRINSGDLEMESTHHGPESLSLSVPGK